MNKLIFLLISVSWLYFVFTKGLEISNLEWRSVVVNNVQKSSNFRGNFIGPRTYPGARYLHHMAAFHGDSHKNSRFYLFGGLVINFGFLGDLWSFSPVEEKWTYIPTAENITFQQLPNVVGVYGNSTEFKSGVYPAARKGGCFVRHENSLFLFGGDRSTNKELADLWEFDAGETEKWKFINTIAVGDSRLTEYQVNGSYGEYLSPEFYPGARSGHICESSKTQGEMYVFGGSGWAGSPKVRGRLADLWVFSENMWRWVNTVNSTIQQSTNLVGNYGTFFNSSFYPGARYYFSSFFVNSSLYIFGGSGYDDNNFGKLADLWEFNTILQDWRFIGSHFQSEVGAVSPCGLNFNFSFYPSARNGASQSYIADHNIFIVFGGQGESCSGENGYLGDIWLFKITEGWRQVVTNSIQVNSSYDGSFGESFSPSSYPGARRLSRAVLLNNNLYMFGGSSSSGYLGDLWQLCFGNFNKSSNCSSCIDGYDISKNCNFCLPNYVVSSNCSRCLQNYDIKTKCQTCDSVGRNLSDSCRSCSDGFFGADCSVWQCGEVFSNDSTKTICGDKGICVSPQNCSCTNGYYSNNCELYNCNQFPFNDSRSCGNNSECTAPDVCRCVSGYINLPNCDIPLCMSIPSNDSRVCFGRGECISPGNCRCQDGDGISKEKSDFCACSDGYVGKDCSSFSCFGFLHTSPDVCFHENGVCENPDMCRCNRLYYGIQCEENILRASTNETHLIIDYVIDEDLSRSKICRSVIVDYKKLGDGPKCLWHVGGNPDVFEKFVVELGNNHSIVENCTIEILLQTLNDSVVLVVQPFVKSPNNVWIPIVLSVLAFFVGLLLVVVVGVLVVVVLKKNREKRLKIAEDEKKKHQSANIELEDIDNVDRLRTIFGDLYVDSGDIKRIKRFGSAGAQGVIYKAKLRHTKDAILKEFKLGASDTSGDISVLNTELQFLQKFKTLSWKTHNVVGFYGISLIDSTRGNEKSLALVLEFCEHGDLTNMDRSLSQTERIKYILDIATGLAVFEEKKYCHRDLKPENILIGYEGSRKCCKLVDFGLSKLSTTLSAGSVRPRGTPFYIAPEFFLGLANREVGYSKCDVFSFGVLSFVILTAGFHDNPRKKLPFDYIEAYYRRMGEREYRERTMLFDENDVAHGDLRPEWPNGFQVDDWLKTLIERCWSKDPEMRPRFEKIVETVRIRAGIAFTCKVKFPELTRHAEYFGKFEENTFKLEGPRELEIQFDKVQDCQVEDANEKSVVFSCPKSNATNEFVRLNIKFTHQENFDKFLENVNPNTE